MLFVFLLSQLTIPIITEEDFILIAKIIKHKNIRKYNWLLLILVNTSTDVLKRKDFTQLIYHFKKYPANFKPNKLDKIQHIFTYIRIESN